MRAGERLCLAVLLVAAAAGCKSGKIVGSADVAGVSVPRLTVTLSGPVAAVTIADASGSYSFGGLPDGAYTISAAAPSTAEGQTQTSAIVANGATAKAPALVLTPVGAIHGKVTIGGATSGNGGIVVMVDGLGQAVYTDDAGDYTLPMVPAGTRAVSATKAAFATSTSSPVNVGYAQSVAAPDLELTAAGEVGIGSVSGIATIFGAADSSGTTVSLVGTTLTTTTDASGSYAFSGVPTGTYALAFENGAVHETIPRVDVLPGGRGLVPTDGGVLYALRPIVLAPPPRIANGASSALLTPDGQRVIYVGADLSINSVGARGGAGVTIAPAIPSTSVAPQIRVTGDSSTIVYWGGDRGLYSAPVGGGAPVQIAPAAWEFDISPAGALVAFTSVGEDMLSVAPIGGGSATTLAGAGIHDPTFSPDGSRVLFLDGSGLQTVAAGGGAPTLVKASANALSRIGQTSFGLAFSTGSNVTLSLVDLNGGTLVRDLAADAYDNFIFHVDFSPDGHSLSYLTNVAGQEGFKVIQSFDTATPLTITLATANANYTFIPPSFSANGNNVFFTSNVVQVAPMGSASPTVTTLSAAGAQVSSPITTPDHLHYVWIETLAGVSRLMTASMNDPAATLAPVALGTLDPATVTWSLQAAPDSGTLLVGGFTSGALIAFPVGGGAPVTLAHDFGGGSFSPDGARVLYSVPTSATYSPSNPTFSIPVGGGAATALLPNAATGTFVWIDNRTVLLTRLGTPAPYGFQDGLYEATLP